MRGALLVFALVAVAFPSQSAEPGLGRFVVIVNESSVSAKITRAELERVYRGITRYWDNGQRIVAVNTQFDDPLREAFNRAILHTSMSQLATYWNRRYYEGVRPPAVLASPEAVVRYVERTAGAVGYIPAGIDTGVARVLEVVDDG